MPFPELVKLEAKRKAHFRCVACHELFVEVHHIVPQKDGGADTLENAAPLCGRCHDLYGGNPEKRKQMRQMRDFWWEHCEKAYPTGADLDTFGKLDSLYEEIKSAHEGGKRMEAILTQIKEELAKLHSAATESIQKATTMDQVVASSEFYASGTKLGEGVFANVKCSRCGTMIGLLVGRDTCPNCGNPIK